MFISSTARSALRPRCGLSAACADSPSKVYSTETMPLDLFGARHPGSRYARDAALDRKASLFEHIGQIFRRLEFLIGELAEAKDGVVHDLRELASALDALDHGRFEFVDARNVVFRRGALLSER